MRKKLILILECILILALLTGCWSRNEPKNMAMINSVLYNITDNGNSQVMVEIMHPTAETGGKGNGSENVSALTLISEGQTMPEAIRNESKIIDKELFGGLNQARLFSEKLCNKGLGPVLDYLSRDHLTDETPLMVVVQDDDPKRIYTCMTGLSDMVGNYLSSLSETQKKSTCEAVFVTCLQFIKDYYTDGKQPVMGLVKIVASDNYSPEKNQTSTNESEELYIKYEGLAAFKGDKLVGYLNGIETRDYNIITNNYSIAFIPILRGNDSITFKNLKSNSRIKINVHDEQVEIDVNIKAVLSIIQGYSSIDISKKEGIKKVEQAFNNHLESEIAKTIEKTQREFKSDIFGFGCFFHAQQPQEWKKIKDNWDDVFTKATISVTVESSVIMEGEIKIPFTMEKQVNDK